MESHVLLSPFAPRFVGQVGYQVWIGPLDRLMTDHPLARVKTGCGLDCPADTKISFIDQKYNEAQIREACIRTGFGDPGGYLSMYVHSLGVAVLVLREVDAYLAAHFTRKETIHVETQENSDALTAILRWLSTQQTGVGPLSDTTMAYYQGQEDLARTLLPRYEELLRIEKLHRSL